MLPFGGPAWKPLYWLCGKPFESMVGLSYPMTQLPVSVAEVPTGDGCDGLAVTVIAGGGLALDAGGPKVMLTTARQHQ
jgi:hypothetical protein